MSFLITFNANLSLQESYEIFEQSTPDDHYINAACQGVTLDPGYSKDDAYFQHGIYAERMAYGEELLGRIAVAIKDPECGIGNGELCFMGEHVKREVAKDHDAQIMLEKLYPDLRPIMF